MKSSRALLILFTALSVLASACNDDPTSPRFTAEEPFVAEAEVTTQTAFQLRAINGDIEITVSDTTGRVTATGFRRVRADAQQEADDALLDLEVQMTSTTGEILLETVQPKDAAGKNYEVEYTITIPGGLAVVLIGANGTMDLDGAEAGLSATLANGSINARNVVGDATLTVANGQIDAGITLRSESVVRAGTGNGTLRIEIPAQTSADVSATVGTGWITTSGLVFTGLVQGSSSLSGRLGDGDGTIDLSTGNGNIALIGN